MALMDSDFKMASKPLQVKEKDRPGQDRQNYYEENCLMQMEFVKRRARLRGAARGRRRQELGGKIAVKSFVRFERGEGISRRSKEDFAARSRRSDEHGQIIPQISRAAASASDFLFDAYRSESVAVLTPPTHFAHLPLGVYACT